MPDPDPPGPPPGGLCREIETSTTTTRVPGGVVSGHCAEEGVQEKE